MGGEIIAIIAIVLILGGAVFYIVKAKKSGKKCIGCPDGCSCSAKGGKRSEGCGGCCCCGEKAQTENGEQLDEQSEQAEQNDCCDENE